MCRLFGFRSILNSKVHSSLVHADNALASQSMRHPDGWGVAFYRENIPHLIRSTDRAFDDHIFHKVSGVVSSQTVLAHIRKATQGKLTLLNCHPFQYGHWVFAHNGNLKNFDSYRDKIFELVSDELKPFILGNTDSEHVFYLLLSLIKKHHSLEDPNPEHSVLKTCIQDLVTIINQYAGALYVGEEQIPSETHLTFLLTSGQNMLGFQGGQSLLYSTHKTKCPESKECPFYDRSCENLSRNADSINHLLFSSEKPEGENIWTEMHPGQLIGLDQNMQFWIDDLNVKTTNQPS